MYNHDQKQTYVQGLYINLESTYYNMKIKIDVQLGIIYNGTLREAFTEIKMSIFGISIKQNYF